MRDVEKLAEDLFQKLCLHKWYVDFIIVLSDEHEDMDSLLKELNRIQMHIFLKCVKKMNNQLPFLSILISRRDDGSIKLSVYRKSIWTGQYCNFHSRCPIHYKRGLIKGLFVRISRIYTNGTTEGDTKLLTKILMNIDYPLKFMNC